VVFQDGGAESSLHNVISSNTVTKTGGTCIAVNSNASSPMTARTVVTSNAISNCGQGGTAKGSGNREGIELNGGGTHYTTIAGNDIYDDQGGSATTLYGVINQTSPTDQAIGPNTITGMVLAAIGGVATPSISSGFGTTPGKVQQSGPASDNIVFADGVKYPCTAEGIQAALNSAGSGGVGGIVILPDTHNSAIFPLGLRPKFGPLTLGRRIVRVE
jgi:hypothetical protein